MLKNARNLPPVARGKRGNIQKPTRAIVLCPPQPRRADVNATAECAPSATPQSKAAQLDMGESASSKLPQPKRTGMDVGESVSSKPPQGKKAELDMGDCPSSARDRFFTPRPWVVDDTDEVRCALFSLSLPLSVCLFLCVCVCVCFGHVSGEPAPSPRDCFSLVPGW
jgi:hypothetical protein